MIHKRIRQPSVDVIKRKPAAAPLGTAWDGDWASLRVTFHGAAFKFRLPLFLSLFPLASFTWTCKRLRQLKGMRDFRVRSKASRLGN